MKKTVSELRKNERVRQLVERGAAPGNRTQEKRKNFVVSVNCAADYPHRVARAEDMCQELLNSGMYGKITPANVMTGEFHVSRGFEEIFKTIAGEHGFRATEVMEC